jgi:hypothetical protein
MSRFGSKREKDIGGLTNCVFTSFFKVNVYYVVTYGMWDSGSTAVPILISGIRERRAFIFKPRPLYSRGIMKTASIIVMR